MDVFLVIVIVILAILLLAAMIVLVVVFGHPDDKNEAKLPKGVTVFGLWLAFASVLLLPYDVANSNGVGGGVDVGLLWQIVYVTLAIMVFLIIPFAYFFYESDVDPEEAQTFCSSQIGLAIQYTIGFFIIFLTILLLLYAFLSEANIPVTQYSQSLSLVFPCTYNNVTAQIITLLEGTCNQNEGCQVLPFLWAIPVTFPIFLMCFVSFVGWFFWTFFVGVGLVALPMDLINDWRTRPTRMDLKTYLQQRERLGRRAHFLIDAGVALQREDEDTKHTQSRDQKRRIRRDLLKFERAYYFLKQDKELLDMCRQLKDTNPLWWILKLVLGILGGSISLSWVLHIIIFVLPKRPIHPFLNNMFIKLGNVGNGSFPLFGICAFATYAFYLLWCCVKGNFKLGIRLAFWKIYPMEVGKTKMNAFLANTWIILLCSVPTVQFCARAFPIYARETQIDLLFGTQIQYLNFFKYFWEQNVFIVALLVVVFISLLYLLMRPRDRAAEVERELDAIANRKPGEEKV